MDTPVKMPAHETIYRALREKILFGELVPGQAVTIQGLVNELAVSMTPVREAIRTLTAEGALELQGNRRVCVPIIGERRFSELGFARLSIEPELAKRAALNMTPDDIEDLMRIDVELNKAIDSGDIHGYMKQNWLFHFTLYGHADSKVLQPLAESLWLRYGPLSRIVSGQYGTRNLVDLHDEALSALRDSDNAGVGDAIRGDIQQGLDIVRESQCW